MKISKKEIGLLVGLFGVLLAVGVYSLFYRPYQDKIASLESELITLQQEESRYAEMQANIPFYQEGIVRLTEQTSAIIKEFPAGITPETEIMYVVEMEDKVDVEIPSISYGSPSSLTGEAAASGLQAFVIPMSVSYKTTYQGLKDTLNYTYDHENRMVIDTVSLSYDRSTGDITGSLLINMYYMEGTDKVYEDPIVPSMNMGVDNIFGTITE